MLLLTVLSQDCITATGARCCCCSLFRRRTQIKNAVCSARTRVDVLCVRLMRYACSAGKIRWLKHDRGSDQSEKTKGGVWNKQNIIVLHTHTHTHTHTYAVESWLWRRLSAGCVLVSVRSHWFDAALWNVTVETRDGDPHNAFLFICVESEPPRWDQSTTPCVAVSLSSFPSICTAAVSRLTPLFWFSLLSSPLSSLLLFLARCLSSSLLLFISLVSY